MRPHRAGPDLEALIPLGAPCLRGNEWRYIKECLDTGWVSSVGAFVERFEREFAAYAGTKHAVATVSGTAALHIALLVADVRADDEVLVSTLTFIAPANAIRYVGAWPVCMDATADYWQIDGQKVREFLERECRWVRGELRNKRSGRRVKAILPVHILGHPVDIAPIVDVARRYSLVVIEDASESLGATYHGRMVGHLGDIACFSFNGNKVITTGGGGMIATDHEGWARRARYLTTQANDDPVEYISHEIGYNYRLTNIQAAMGCAQLEQISEFLAAKRRSAAGYRAALEDIPGLTPMQEAPWACSSFWLFTALVDEARYGTDSRTVLRHLRQRGIQARPLWQPVHRSPAHRGAQAYRVEVADRLHRSALSLPSSVGLSQTELSAVVDTLRIGRT